MYKAAEYFTLEARKAAAEHVYDQIDAETADGKVYRCDGGGFCVVGRLLKYDPRTPLTSRMPDAGFTVEDMQNSGVLPTTIEAHTTALEALRELMRANDAGELSTPEAVREALGVNV